MCIIRNSKKEIVERWSEKIRDKTPWIMPTKNFVPGHTNKWVIWRSVSWY